MDCLSHVLPKKHSSVSVLYAQLGSLCAINNKLQLAKDSLQHALLISEETYGNNSYFYALAEYNTLLVDFICLTQGDHETFEISLNKAVQFFPEKHPVREAFELGMLLDNVKLRCSEGISTNAHCLWKVSVVSLLDHPFSWLDYPPVSKAVVLGADYQVWAHVEKRLHRHPFRYSWVSTVFPRY